MLSVSSMGTKILIKNKKSNVLSTKRKRFLIQRNGNEVIIIIIDTYSCARNCTKYVLWLVTIIKILNFFYVSTYNLNAITSYE